MESLAQRLIHGSLAAVLAVVGFDAYKLHNLNELIVHRLQEQPLQSLEQTVTNAAGESVKVITVRQTGESVADFVARHNEAVAAVKASGG